jgi:hypothetical protein
MEIITSTALAAGIPRERVMSVSAADNLTLPRPRVEVDFLPDNFTRTGRKLAVSRKEAIQTTKKELYETRLDLTAHVYAESPEWLEAFEYEFVKAFPPGLNDSRGNWIKIRVNRATFSKERAKRVGQSEIKVFSKVDTLFLVTLTGRITGETEIGLITDIDVSVAPQTGAKE